MRYSCFFQQTYLKFLLKVIFFVCLSFFQTDNESSRPSPQVQQSCSTSAAKSPSHESSPSTTSGKPTKHHLAEMQLRLTAVESALTKNQAIRVECGQQIAILRRKLAKELQKKTEVGNILTKLSEEAIDLKVALQTGISKFV